MSFQVQWETSDFLRRQYPLALGKRREFSRRDEFLTNQNFRMKAGGRQELF
jgi:hypothetical protein